MEFARIPTGIHKAQYRYIQDSGVSEMMHIKRALQLMVVSISLEQEQHTDKILLQTVNDVVDILCGVLSPIQSHKSIDIPYSLTAGLIQQLQREWQVILSSLAGINNLNLTTTIQKLYNKETLVISRQITPLHELSIHGRPHGRTLPHISNFKKPVEVDFAL